MSVIATKPVLLVTAASLAPETLDMLGDFRVVFADGQPTGDDIVMLCARHRPVAIVVRYDRINARIMDAAAGNLQVTSKHGNDINVVDQDAATARDTAMRAAVSINAAAVAEYMWTLILVYAESIPQLDTHMHAGHWDKATHKSIKLDGRTLGLVDLGAIGRRTAAVDLVFGMKVLAFDPYTKEAPAGVRLVALGELYTQSDVVPLHCPLIAENRKVLNRDAFSYFKPGVILVNTARGGLIDEAALVETLTNDRLRAAGLGSFDVEPMTAPHPFQGIANIILPPHIGGVSDVTYLNMGKGATINVLAVIEGRARMAA